jgi:hypothetical protein
MLEPVRLSRLGAVVHWVAPLRRLYLKHLRSKTS